MAISPVQKHHLARNLLLAKQIWEWSSGSISELAKANPGLLSTNVDWNFIPGSKRLSKKTYDDTAKMRNVLVGAYQKVSESLPDDGVLHLYIAMETTHLLLLSALAIHPEVTESPQFKDLNATLIASTNWLVENLSEGSSLVAEEAVDTIHSAVTDLYFELDGNEDSYWVKGKRFTNWQAFGEAVFPYKGDAK